MAWSQPKVNWTAGDGIGSADLNLIGTNANGYEGFINNLHLVKNSGNELKIFDGMAYIDGLQKIIKKPSITTKLLTSDRWTSGSGVAGKAFAVTITNNVFYHVFLLSNSVGVTDIAFDSDYDGGNILIDSNIQAAGYIYKRRIGAILYRYGIYNFFQINNQFCINFELSGEVTSIDPIFFPLPSKNIILNFVKLTVDESIPSPTYGVTFSTTAEGVNYTEHVLPGETVYADLPSSTGIMEISADLVDCNFSMKISSYIDNRGAY